MKTMARIVLYLMILCFCGCSSKKDEVIIAVNTGNRVGYFTDSKGNIIIDKQFDGVSSFSNGLAKVKQNGKWGFVNTKGEIVIPCVYDELSPFINGFATARINYVPDELRGSVRVVYFIDKTGKIIKQFTDALEVEWSYVKNKE